MRISIIANGFQQGYTYDMINGLAGTNKPVQFELIGSAIYDPDMFDNRVRFLNLAGHPDSHSFTEKILRNLRYYARLIKYVCKAKPDLLHFIWLNLTLIDGIILPLFFKICGIKICYTAHDVLPHSRDHWLNRFLFYFIYHIPHHLFVHTEFIKSRIVNEFGIETEKITIIKHGVYAVEDDPELDKHNARNQLGIGQEEFVLLFFGIITRYKGLNILLEALSKVNGNITNPHLMIAGRINEQYKPEFQALLDSYKNLKITAKNGFIEDSKLQLYFKSADVTVLPYLEASQSGVLFLSYSYGIPVIAPDMGGFSTDVIEGKTGYLFKPGNTDSLFQTLLKFHQEMNYNTRELKNDIKRFSAENYSWTATGNVLCETYSGLKKLQTSNIS